MPCQRLYVSNGSLELELHNFGHKFGQLGMAIEVLKWVLVSGNILSRFLVTNSKTTHLRSSKRWAYPKRIDSTLDMVIDSMICSRQYL